MTRKPLLSSFYHIILVYIKLLLAWKKTKTFCGVFCERATPGGYLKFLHFFYFPHLSKNCFRIKLYLKQTLPFMSSWPPRAKFVDDLTLLEIVPRNSPPVMNFLVKDIHQYANSHNMRLNPKNVIQWRLTFLSITAACGVPLLSATRSWSARANLNYSVSSFRTTLRVTYIVQLYSRKPTKGYMRFANLKKSGVSEKDLVAVYCTLIRSVIEYGFVVFANMTKRLCNALEKIQKRALSIIYPAISYDDALAKANLVSLECRRHDLCYKYINSLPEDHPVKKIIYARTVDIPQHCEPRSNASRRLAPARTNRQPIRICKIFECLVACCV